MSDEMPSWKFLANAASRSIKNYVSQRDYKRPSPITREVSLDGSSRRKTWGQWAGQKLRQVQGEPGASVENVLFFPGWATRRFHDPLANSADDAPFDVEVFVSGFASRSNGLGFGTRSGKAFLKLAKSIAALPKLTTQIPVHGYTDNWSTNKPISTSTENLIGDKQMPLPPDQMDGAAEIAALENQLRQLDVDADNASTNGETESVASSHTSHSSTVHSPISEVDLNGQGSNVSQELHKWHANLEARLHPFWASAVSSRRVRISLYATNPSLAEADGHADSAEEIFQLPLMRREVVTAMDGSFQVRFQVPWKTLCLHPQGVLLAFDDRKLEHDFYVIAELQPPSPRQSNSSPYQPPAIFPVAPVTQSISIPLSFAPVRIISDIDDTVKLAGVLSGARAVFHNVFVKDLEDSIIPGMAEWYTDMWKRGARFHYVSNGPFEIMPVLTNFFQLTRLPPGSVRLRSYGGRSLFSDLLSAPATRKRGGVLDVLDSFPQARFFLIGDSGEQDLELYASIAKERPAQILAVFVRDVGAEREMEPLDDPTGSRVLRLEEQSESGPYPFAPSMSSRSSSKSSTSRGSVIRSITDTYSAPRYAPRKPMRMYSDTEVVSGPRESTNGYFNSTSLTASPVTEEPEEMSTQSSPGVPSDRVSGDVYSGTRQYVSDVERRRSDLQMRVWRARLDIPDHIPLRIFRTPEECEEAAILLDGLTP
ncbi:uncharacterized protein FIBRA_04688 [Fibroporia radiculosa]|uniref:Phosphatidate phosphatase APP1 catalytic domain-containing protein n=1 Tax=Fibroporia radiculosa TaxID=599839 RepID=J4GPN2_9APHY|nr:uncharacterized protein FIBRA_04688 [Fibroporia radiculosa]CCM02585.1 predicted protein [Fibroporia radiculosa]